MTEQRPRWQDVMDAKHADHIRAHEASYGVKLGEAKHKPDAEQLQQDFEDRKAEGSLLSQQRELLERVDHYEKLDQQDILEHLQEEAGL